MAELKEEDPKSRAWGLFLYAQTLVLERIEAALRAAGLPPLAWYDVLWELERADGGRLRMHELAQRIVLSRSNLTRLADRLEDAGLIVREACPDDRRGAFCVITPAGRQTREKMWPVYSEQIDKLFAQHLTDEVASDMAKRFAAIARAARGSEAAQE